MLKGSRSSKGFTLIELLIVIAIIGILAAIAIPAYTGYSTKARISGVTNAMGSIKNAVYAYYSEALQFPAALTTAAAIGTTLGVTPSDQYASAWDVGTNGNGVIQVTLQNVGSGQDGQTITLTPTWTGATPGQGPWTWTWTGSVAASYLPKT